MYVVAMSTVCCSLKAALCTHGVVAGIYCKLDLSLHKLSKSDIIFVSFTWILCSNSLFRVSVLVVDNWDIVI